MSLEKTEPRAVERPGGAAGPLRAAEIGVEGLFRGEEVWSNRNSDVLASLPQHNQDERQGQLETNSSR